MCLRPRRGDERIRRFYRYSDRHDLNQQRRCPDGRPGEQPIDFLSLTQALHGSFATKPKVCAWRLALGEVCAWRLSALPPCPRLASSPSTECPLSFAAFLPQFVSVCPTCPKQLSSSGVDTGMDFDGSPGRRYCFQFCLHGGGSVWHLSFLNGHNDKASQRRPQTATPGAFQHAVRINPRTAGPC